MTPRHTVFTILAGLHLALVACGAANWNILSPKTDAGQALAVLKAYTGSDSSYAFFAPGVSNTTRATFVLIDADGKEWTDTLEGNMSREAKLRVGSGLSMVGSGLDLPPDQQLRLAHEVAKSWAATMLGRHPNAVTIKVGMEDYLVPPMEMYREGKRPEWVQFFPPADEPKLGEFNRK